jgi:hypothetical protein
MRNYPAHVRNAPAFKSGAGILAQLSDDKAAVKASLRSTYPEQFAALRKNIADIQRKIACLDDGVDLGGKRSTLVALRDKQIARLHQVADACGKGRYLPITRSAGRVWNGWTQDGSVGKPQPSKAVRLDLGPSYEPAPKNGVLVAR